jgi:hypothetical protein
MSVKSTYVRTFFVVDKCLYVKGNFESAPKLLVRLQFHLLATIFFKILGRRLAIVAGSSVLGGVANESARPERQDSKGARILRH